MTEEQVKQIVVSMIEDGELDIDIKEKSIRIPTFNRGAYSQIKDTYITVSINHNKDGYSKRIFEKTINI